MMTFTSNKTVLYSLVASVILGLNSTYASADDDNKPVTERLVNTLSQLAGEHQGVRKNHAKGIIAEGYFTPTSEAKKLSSALHLQDAPSPIIVRFSNATGVPNIPDANANAFPKGIAVRFDMGDEGYTDLVCISVNSFPSSTPEEFLGLLQAIASTTPDSPSPSPIVSYLDSHPAAKRFVEIPKLPPQSFATQPFYGVNSFKFINDQGDEHFGRYIIEPVAGVKFFTESEQQNLDDNYLMDELPKRLSNNKVEYKIFVQLAGANDDVNDATVTWPASRDRVEIGTLTLTQMYANADTFAKENMFNPLAIPEGIEASDDPILLARPGAYAVSFGRRISGH